MADFVTKEYRFLEAEHLHELNVNGEWKPLSGVTQVLKTISKGGALTQWSANLAAEHFKGNWGKELNEEELDNLYHEARFLHKKKKEEAGGIGTKAHSLIEKFIKEGEWISEKEDSQIKKIFLNFVDWHDKNKVMIVENEKHVWSKEHWIGGICDLLIVIDGKLWIGDIKTSNSGIYPENFLQTAAYDLCLDEMGIKDIEGYIVINLKKNGEVEIKKSLGRETCKAGFLACLKLYKILQEL